MSYKSFETSELSLPEKHGFLLSGVAPRPIALVSSIDKEGNVNLAPFSNFNAFGSNPPILIFSASRSGRTGETKDTYKNVKEVPEVVINIVEYDMVQQISLASSEFPKGVNEFVKSGLTELASDIVKPPRVAESPIQYECKVKEVIELGTEGGAGNLVICEVVKFHINERVLDKNGKIDPLMVHQVSRCGGAYYSQLEGSKMFAIAQPQAQLGIGVDGLESDVRNSKVLTGNDLGQLGLSQTLPTEQEIKEFKATETYKYLESFSGEEKILQVHKAAQEMLGNNNLRLAIITLYAYIY